MVSLCVSQDITTIVWNLEQDIFIPEHKPEECQTRVQHTLYGNMNQFQIWYVLILFSRSIENTDIIQCVLNSWWHKPILYFEKKILKVFSFPLYTDWSLLVY